MLRALLRSPLTSVLRDLIRKFKRWAYTFDGVDDRGQMAFRAINPDGDIDIEWGQIGVSNAGGSPQTIITQSISTTIASREFVLRWNDNSGGLQLSVGGAGLSLTIPCLDGRYRVTYSGSTYTVFYNGVLSRTGSFTRGTAREPNAVTMVASRNNAGAFTEHTLGSLYDVRINGTLYPMADRNQAIQLPSPSGLGPELITQSVLENPNNKGSQWTYLGDGRWQLVGDGNLNALQFINSSQQPSAGYIEFEVESISGGSITSAQNNASAVVSSVGKHRRFYTELGNNLDNMMQFKRASGSVTCVIKNISFKPLWVASATELVTNGGLTGATATTVPSWVPINSAVFSYNAGNLVITNGAAAAAAIHQNVPTEAGQNYLVTAVLKAGNATAKLSVHNGSSNWSGNILQVGSAPNATISVPFRALGAISNVTLFVSSQTQGVSMEIQSISVRKLDSLCNPLTLTNTASTGWQETEV